LIGLSDAEKVKATICRNGPKGASDRPKNNFLVLTSVILSAAKNLPRIAEILRCAQDDSFRLVRKLFFGRAFAQMLTVTFSAA
jgi:hypothetical protein